MKMIKRLTLIVTIASLPFKAMADEPFLFRVQPDGAGGFAVLAGVDFATLTPANRTARQQRRDARQSRRASMTTTEKVGDHFRERWGWYAAGVGLLATDRVAANNDWLWYDWFGGSGSGSSTTVGDTEASTGQRTQDGNNYQISQDGSGNTINIYASQGE